LTYRELTGLLSKPDFSGDIETPISRLAWRIAFGAISWPWLLASLHGGRVRDKRALMDTLELPHDALPHLGSWKADVSFLNHIVREIRRINPSNVVELGAGASTLVAAQALRLQGAGRLHSVDQHAEFAAATAQWLAEYDLVADVRHAPLEVSSPNWPYPWYRLEDIPARIDLLIIDGPPWAVHPLVRGAAECLFPRLSPGAVILLDDAARPGERIVAHRWRKRWPDIDFQLMTDGSKGTLVGYRAG